MNHLEKKILLLLFFFSYFLYHHKLFFLSPLPIAKCCHLSIQIHNFHENLWISNPLIPLFNFTPHLTTSKRHESPLCSPHLIFISHLMLMRLDGLSSGRIRDWSANLSGFVQPFSRLGPCIPPVLRTTTSGKC